VNVSSVLTILLAVQVTTAAASERQVSRDQIDRITDQHRRIEEKIKDLEDTSSVTQKEIAPAIERLTSGIDKINVSIDRLSTGQQAFTQGQIAMLRVATKVEPMVDDLGVLISIMKYILLGGGGLWTTKQGISVARSSKHINRLFPERRRFGRRGHDSGDDEPAEKTR
jgi:hypothetical protein